MAQKVILHVGAPKTGTSFVQDLLFREREALRDRGILYPAEQFDSHFRAALDLMQLPWGGLEWQASGTWDEVARQVRAWPGTAVISHEILATASRQHVARALESLGDGDTEIHLLYSARDLVRQIPAEWQENVKHRRTTTYAEFLAVLMDPARADEIAQWFFGVQEIPDVLDRWASSLPRERVHVLTVPPPGAPRELLWERFASVIGIDPHDFTPAEEGRANASLGVPEVAVLRLLNERIEDIVWNLNYRPIVREYLVHQRLSHNISSPRIGVPQDAWDWATDLSRTWVAELERRGYDVVGDLADLVPQGDAPPFVDPDHPDPAAVAEVALQALAEMTKEAARLRNEEEELHAHLADVSLQLHDAHSTPVWKYKEKLVRKAESSRVAHAGLAAYRRVRGRSSRST